MQKSDKLKFSAIIRGFEIQSTRKLKKEEKKQRQAVSNGLKQGNKAHANPLEITLQ